MPLVYKDTKRLRGRDRHITIIAMQGVRTLPMISVCLDFKESALLSLSSNLIWGFEKKKKSSGFHQRSQQSALRVQRTMSPASGSQKGAFEQQW